jgi:hypothetical protein
MDDGSIYITRNGDDVLATTDKEGAELRDFFYSGAAAEGGDDKDKTINSLNDKIRDLEAEKRNFSVALDMERARRGAESMAWQSAFERALDAVTTPSN